LTQGRAFEGKRFGRGGTSGGKYTDMAFSVRTSLRGALSSERVVERGTSKGGGFSESQGFKLFLFCIVKSKEGCFKERI